MVCVAMWMLCAPLGAKSIPHPHRQPRQVVHIIQNLEMRLQQAELTGNISTIASMLSDDYLGIYADGMLATKADTLASLKNGTVHYTSIHTFDRKIRVYGSTAVVVSKAKVEGVKDGQDISGNYRYTRVYHRTNRVWKVVSFEASSMHEHKPAH
jgi:ketosteroid isomerase-like protein